MWFHAPTPYEARMLELKVEWRQKIDGYLLLYPLPVLNISFRLLDEPPGCGPPPIT